MIFSQKHIALVFLFFSGIFFGFYIAKIPTQPNNIITTSLSQIASWSIFWSSSGSVSDSIFDSKKIQEAKKLIQTEYYHFSEKTKDEIENGMITSLVASLWDKHSSYFPPKEASDFSDTLRGDFEWIGAVIDENPKWIKIQKVLEGSPAEKWGLKNGDIITMVDTTSLVWFTADEAVQKIRGPKWSKVILSYLRGDNETVQKVEITRDTVLVPSTQEKMFTGSKIGYLEVGFFWEHTTQEFEKSLKSLTNSGAEWIILDFRNNPGGFLDSAVEILSMVLPADTVAVITRENDAKKNQTLYTIAGKFSNTQVPIVMLVNEYSASASEIVAGALQDYGRAILIGEKTYGKWSVQSPFVLSDGSILKLTIGRWYTPKDRWIDQEGIHPDISIVLKDEDYKNAYDRQLEGAKKVMQELLKSKGDVPKTIESMKNTTF